MNSIIEAQITYKEEREKEYQLMIGNPLYHLMMYEDYYGFPPSDEIRNKLIIKARIIPDTKVLDEIVIGLTHSDKTLNDFEMIKQMESRSMSSGTLPHFYNFPVVERKTKRK